MKRGTGWIADRIAHYPVLFIGAVVATIKWRWRHMDNVDDIMLGAWATFFQTILSASRKGLEEAKEASRNEALADVASLSSEPGPPPILVAQPKPVEDTNPL